MILDTYDLGNGNYAELFEAEDMGEHGLYFINIQGQRFSFSNVPVNNNPFDSIFILLDLGLIKVSPYEAFLKDIDCTQPMKFKGKIKVINV